MNVTEFSFGIGGEDKRTNNRTMLPALKTMQLQVIRVQWKESFERRRATGYRSNICDQGITWVQVCVKDIDPLPIFTIAS